MLFLQQMISKMKPVEDGGSRIAIVFNGSPLFTGSAGGASYLEFSVPYGGAMAGGLAFGEFPDTERQKAFGVKIESDDRNAGADRFVFKTVDGKLVSARIVSREYPKIVIDYVLRK